MQQTIICNLRRTIRSLKQTTGNEHLDDHPLAGRFYWFFSVALVGSILSGCGSSVNEQGKKPPEFQARKEDDQSFGRLPTPPTPTIVGKWNVVQGPSEVFTFGADGIVHMEGPGEKLTGVFSYTAPQLDCSVNYLGTMRKVSFSVAFLSDTDMVLRSSLKNPITGRTFNVLKRWLPGEEEPKLRDVRNYKTWLLGTWEHARTKDLLNFNEDGTFSSIEGSQSGLEGVFAVSNDELQLISNISNGIRQAPFAIIELNQKELHLLSNDDVRVVYRRQK